MYAVLGDIAFEVSSEYARTISEMTLEHTYKYAEHEIITGKSKLQYLGKQLDKIGFKGILSDYFCNPEDEIKKLMNEANKRKPLVFVVGENVLGEFIIEKIRQTWKDVSVSGKVRTIEMEIELKEYH